MTTPLDPSNLADRTDAEPLPAGAQLSAPDFSRPRKLSPADLGVLGGLQERFARSAGDRLARLLHCDVDVAFGAPEEITVLAHARALGETSVVAGIQIVPVPGLLLLEIAPEVALAVVERLLGGAGNPAPARGLTELETGLVADAVRQILPAFADALAPAEVEAAVAGIGAGPEALAGPSPVEPAVVLPFSLTLSTGNPPVVAASGPLALFGLLSTVRPLLDQISPPAAADPDPIPVDQGQPGSPMGASVRALLADVPVSLDVRLRPSRVPARDIVGLRPGDVLRLDHGVDEPAIGSVRGVELLEGHVGGRARRLGIRFAGWRAGQ
jgi:flagellar motor switch protein FliM